MRAHLTGARSGGTETENLSKPRKVRIVVEWTRPELRAQMLGDRVTGNANYWPALRMGKIEPSSDELPAKAMAPATRHDIGRTELDERASIKHNRLVCLGPGFKEAGDTDDFGLLREERRRPAAFQELGWSLAEHVWLLDRYSAPQFEQLTIRGETGSRQKRCQRRRGYVHVRHDLSGEK